MRITIHDIAAKVGVSHTTVSRVINKASSVKPETRKLVEKAIAELGFVPNAYARGLSQSKTNVIGIVVPEIRNPFFGEIIEGITSVADSNDFNVLLFNSDEDPYKEERALRILQENRIRGLIITPAPADKSFDRAYLNSIEDMKIPMVLVDRYLPQGNIDGVYYDDTQAIFEATSLLIKEGHRDIVILGGNPKLDLAINRVDGYRRAFEYHNLKYDDKNIIFGTFTIDWAYEESKAILDRQKPPTALIACNNRITLGCMKTLHERRIKIPDDIAIIGYDKIDFLDIFHTNITLVERNLFEYGQAAMNLLLSRMDNPGASPQKVILSAMLKLRGSEKLIRKRKGVHPE